MSEFVCTGLVSHGDITAINKLRKVISKKDGALSFDVFIQPNKYVYRGGFAHSKREIHGTNELRDWRFKKLEKTWDCDEVSVTVVEDGATAHLSIEYMSPWRPAFPVMEVMAQSNPKLNFLMKFSEECRVGTTDVGTTLVGHFDAKKGFRQAIKKMAFPYDPGGDLEVKFAYEIDDDFIKECSKNPNIQKAMMMLGYCKNELDGIIEASFGQ